MTSIKFEMLRLWRGKYFIFAIVTNILIFTLSFVNINLVQTTFTGNSGFIIDCYRAVSQLYPFS